VKLEDGIFKIIGGTNMNLNTNVQEILNLVQECQNSKGATGMLITGETGTGKTLLVKQYLETQKNKEKIMVVTAPIQSTLRAFNEELLEQIGDPFPNKGPFGMKMRRLIELIKTSNIELIMVDDFQRVFGGNRQNASEVLECLVHLMEKTNVSFVFLGSNESKRAHNLNERFSRRVPLRIELNHLGAEEEMCS
jgi:type II secretory pathway predicted ATPase ExeA